MTTVSIWQVIKVCVIILLVLWVIKKCLKAYREHRKEMKKMDNDGYRLQLQREDLERKQFARDTLKDVMEPGMNLTRDLVNGTQQTQLQPMTGGDVEEEDENSPFMTLSKIKINKRKYGKK